MINFFVDGYLPPAVGEPSTVMKCAFRADCSWIKLSNSGAEVTKGKRTDGPRVLAGPEMSLPGRIISAEGGTAIVR